MLQLIQEDKTLERVPRPQDTEMSPLPPSPSDEAVMCPPPPTGCCDTLVRLRMLRCILLQAQSAEKAKIAKGSHQKIKSPKLGTLSQQGAGGQTERLGCPNHPIW